MKTPRRWRLLATAGVAFLAAFGAVALHAGEETPVTTEWPLVEFAEPSGVVYHPLRNSLFLVGDRGDIGEVSLEGKLLRQTHLGGDLEGIAVDPRNGLLYVVREGHEIVFEVRPEDFKLLRRFTVNRSFRGDPDFLKRGGDGLEGLAFVPDDEHPEGGRLWAVNQFDPPVLVELGIALKSSKEKFQTATVQSAVPMGLPPLSDLCWNPKRRKFLVVSALWRRVAVLDAEGKQERSVHIPGFMPEGLAILPDGRIVIAQDSGGLLVWTPDKDPFEGEVASGPPAPSSSAPQTAPATGKAAQKASDGNSPDLPAQH